MDATQLINDSILESDEEENEDIQTSRGRPVAKLHILKNEHMPERDFPLFLGENVLGRDGSTCTVSLPSPSVSKQHATIAISLYRSRGDVNMEALIWDLGSLNGTRKGRLKLTPNVRYALSEHDSLVLADIPCQYVSCSADTVSPQYDFKTSVSGSSVVDSRLTDASNEKESGPAVSCEEAHRAPEAKVSSPPLKDTKNTPVRSFCLAFKQTPSQPQGTLVPESDVDSDEERESGASRRQKTLDSDSDLNKSNPTCSSFLSPTNKIVPESEDESPITPPFSTKNRPHRHASFNKEESNINVDRQQLKEKTASEGEDERAALEGKISDMPENQESNVGLTDDKLPISTPAVITDAFKMDSDTDLEGEEEGVASATAVTLTANQRVDHTSERAQFYMNSDTDVEENDDAPHTAPESAPPPERKTTSIPALPAFQAEGISLDSDTDVDDESALDAVSIAKPTSVQSKNTASSAATTPLKQFHLDSDTESEEEDMKAVQSDSSSKVPDTSAKLAETISAALPRPDSETDDEAVPVLATSESAATGSGPAADVRVDVDILSDSDTDVEPGSPLLKQTSVGTDRSPAHGAPSKALQSDSDVDTDVEESCTDLVLQAVALVPGLVSENTPEVVNSSHQYCSTPVQVPGSQVEQMGTQPFLSPASGRCVAIPALRIEAFTFDSDSQEDQNVAVAETQSFVLQSGACWASRSDGHIRETTQASGPATTEDEIIKQSCGEALFQLGLSDSSHLQDPLQALAMESTQAFVSAEATQLYEASSHANQPSSTNDSQLEATQAYGNEEEEKEPAICSAEPEREGGGDLSLEPTQVYVSEPYHDSDETDDDEKRAVTSEEAQPFYVPTSATLAMAETQPMCAFTEEEEEEEEEVVKFPVSSAGQVKVGSESDTGERGEHRGAVVSQKRPFRECLSPAESQPMSASDDRERDEEDSFPRQRKRKTQQLQSKEEQTQPLTSLEQSLVETQPLQSADETPAPPAHEAFQEDRPVAGLPNSQTLQKKPALITSDLAETQLMITGEDEESEESILFLTRPRRTAKPLRQLEEETHTPIVPEASGCETQPMDSLEDGGGVDSLPVTGITKVKPVLIPEEKTQPLANPESSETPLLEAEAESGGSKRGTRARSRNVSRRHEEPSRRQTRGRKDVLAAAPRGRSKSGGDERKEEEEEHPKEAGERKSRRQRTDVENKEPDISPKKNQGEPSLGEKRSEPDLKPHLRENPEEERKEPGEEMEQEQIHSEIKEGKERIEAGNAQMLRLEWERAEKEKMERERKEQEERAERRLKDTEQKEREDKERLEHKRAERGDGERLEGEKNARMSSGRKQEKKEMLESERREHDDREVQHHSARQESEAKELDSVGSSEKGMETEEKTPQEQREEDKANVSARGRRAARRTAAAEPAKDSAAANEDVPARRTRSRSNSSNSLSSERSASSVSTQESRGRGRGARRSSDPPQALASRSSNRRRTVARHSTQVDSKDVSGGLFTSDSSLSQSSRGRGRGGRQPPGGRAAEAGPVSLAVSQGELQTATRGRKINKPESSHEREKADSQQAAASRGRWRSSSNGSEVAEAEGRCRANEDSNQKVRGRSCKAAKGGVVLVPGSPAASHLEVELKKGRKRESEANSEDGSGTSSKIFKEMDKEPTSGEAGEAATHPAQTEVPVRAKRRGRASATQTKTAPRAAEAGPGMKDRTAEEAAERGRGRPSAAQKKTKAEPEDTDTSAEHHECVLQPEVQTPARGVSRKRQAPVDSSPLPKTRSSSLSPSPRSRVLGHTYKVLFTGVADEAGGRALARLGGSMAKGVADMNCLVTDKVRRTVKFLCAVAKGIPVVTTQWLEKSGKAGSFLPPSSFVVKDQEQEKKFSFCLQESLLVASRQPLFQGYQIHVTKSVQPEPVQMKDILACSGATFLPKMPSSHKALTVVISCEEDWHLCPPALSASVPIVTAEFVLSGILQQKVDLQTHALPAPVSSPQPAAGRARGRKKT